MKTSSGEALQTIEQLQEKYRTKAHIHAGVCSRNGWKKGRLLTESEYQGAVKAFLETGMGDR